MTRRQPTCYIRPLSRYIKDERQGQGRVIYDICSRCHRPMTRDDQTCFFKGQRWPCVARTDKTVIRVDGLLIKTGDQANPVPIWADPYA